ncbi:uncharacterized protein LOC125436992 [Sphaerodactylus townsendi]|uniref:uncharacterized protein LOC125436992 n=1 Tax=Sphaerodactylus townsendi TaxID=933632 RepID=UPI002026E384|nr:uncharacterized protein LOC125436992 [Sphaerodactylus townsendi]
MLERGVGGGGRVSNRYSDQFPATKLLPGESRRAHLGQAVRGRGGGLKVVQSAEQEGRARRRAGLAGPLLATTINGTSAAKNRPSVEKRRARLLLSIESPGRTDLRSGSVWPVQPLLPNSFSFPDFRTKIVQRKDCSIQPQQGQYERVTTFPQSKGGRGTSNTSCLLKRDEYVLGWQRSCGRAGTTESPTACYTSPEIVLLVRIYTGMSDWQILLQLAEVPPGIRKQLATYL